MTEPEWSEEADRRTSQWLDTDAAGGQPFSESPLPVDQQDQVRVADLRLVDALLVYLSGHAPEQQEERIRRVMQAINDLPPSIPSKRQLRRWPSAVAIAATLMVAVGLVWSQFVQHTRATEVLREIGQSAMERIDRKYDLRRDVPRDGATQQLDGELYLRGRDGFVLLCGTVVLGRSGDEYWLVDKSGDVVVAESFEWMVAKSERGRRELELLKALSVDSRQVPLMQLSSVVELMQHDYEVALRSDGNHRGQPVDEIVGTLRNAASELPDRICIWSDKDSRIIRRAELSWGLANTLVFELAPATDIPANWYQHQAHHAGQRPVRRVTDGK
jgi:hypothetical protein